MNSVTYQRQRGSQKSDSTRRKSKRKREKKRKEEKDELALTIQSAAQWDE
jgi:hypothetical protein